jgi:hypothetical protein
MNNIFTQMNKRDKKEKTFRVDHPSKLWHKFQSPFQLATFLSNQERILEVMKLLSPKKPKGMTKVRIGEQNDGGYVFVEDLLKNGTVAYSIGIGGTLKFEEAIEKYGHHIWMYDHTVDGSRFKTPNRTIQRIGIGPKTKGNIHTLEKMIADNKHQKETNMLLQMDCEGAEWEVFANGNPLDLIGFSQLCIEMHWFVSYFSRADTTNLIERALQNLRLNFTPCHVHANNWSGFYKIPGKPPIAETFEVTWIRNDLVEWDDSEEIYPTEFDSPCNATRYEIELGNAQW